MSRVVSFENKSAESTDVCLTRFNEALLSSGFYFIVIPGCQMVFQFWQVVANQMSDVWYSSFGTCILRKVWYFEKEEKEEIISQYC